MAIKKSMQRYLPIFLLAILILGCVTPPVTPSATPPAAPPPATAPPSALPTQVEPVAPITGATQTYADSDGRFVFRYPAGWQAQFSKDLDATDIRISKSNETATLLVLVDLSPSVRSLSQEQLAANARALMEGYVNTSIFIVSRGERSWVAFEGVDTSDVVTGHRLGYWYSGQNGSVVVMVGGSPLHAAEDKPLLYPVLDSFAFSDGRAAVAPPNEQPQPVPMTFFMENEENHSIRLKVRINGQNIFWQNMSARVPGIASGSDGWIQNITLEVPDQFFVLEAYEKVANITQSGVVDPSEGSYVIVAVVNNSLILDQKKELPSLE